MGGDELKVTVGIGTVYLLEDMPARADSALYKAENGGCSRIRLYGE